MDAADLTLSILSIFGEHCTLAMLGLSTQAVLGDGVRRTMPV
jgi:hypothetical protein